MELSSSLLGCSRMLWFHKKRLLKKLKGEVMTKKDYDNLKKDGQLYEMFPKATGDYDEDADYVFIERMKAMKNKRVPKKGYRFMNPYDNWSD